MIRLKNLPVSYQTSNALHGYDPEDGISFIVHYNSSGESWFETDGKTEDILESINSDIDAGEIDEWFSGESRFVDSCDGCGELVRKAKLTTVIDGNQLCDECAEEQTEVCPWCESRDFSDYFSQMGSKKVCSFCQQHYHGRSEYPWDYPPHSGPIPDGQLPLKGLSDDV